MTPAMLTKILINLLLFTIILIGSGIYLYKLKLEHKGYKFLFLSYTVFWIAPMLLRSYSGTLQNAIDKEFLLIALSAYGIVGIFIRPLADIFNFRFKSRKYFLYFACISQIVLYLPVLIVPNTPTSIIQSIGVGIGASCIGSFQLLFKEQYISTKSYLNVSLLSIPPLIANFLTAPLQSLLMIGSKTEKIVDVNILKYLWLIGLIFSILALIMMFFVKEDKKRFGIIKNQVFKNRQDYFMFFLLCIIGSIVAFIKFSNSGSIGTLHLQILGDLSDQDTSSYEGYLSVIFSLFQLAGGILVGTVLINKISKTWIFSIGIFCWLIYMLSSSFIINPIGYFLIHGINGFAYGLLYNFVLGSVLNYDFKNKIITPMSIYQSILSIGIALSSIFTQFIKNELNVNFYDTIKIINFTLMGVSLVLLILYLWYERISKNIKFLSKNKNFMIKNQKN